MNAMARIALSATSFFFFAYDAYSQQAAQEKTGTISMSVQAVANNPPRATTIRLSAPSSHRPVVTGEPYSAEVVSERIQTLANGTHITQKAQSTKQYRDSEGRTRTETLPGGAQVVEIHDSVTGFSYILDVQNHIAHRFAPPTEKTVGVASYGQVAPADSPSANSAPARDLTPTHDAPDRPQTSTESLGSQTIEGVYVEGQKTTVTFPVGLTGNDRPLVRVMESWISPALKITVVSKNSDPRMGDSTMHLRNINLSELDPALFSVPADYQIIDENGEKVEIKITRP
jgi:hypothetical protein